MHLTERDKTSTSARLVYPYTPPASAEQQVAPRPEFELLEMKCACGQASVARIERPTIRHAGHYYYRALSPAELQSFAGKTSPCSDCSRRKHAVAAAAATAEFTVPAAPKTERSQ